MAVTGPLNEAASKAEGGSISVQIYGFVMRAHRLVAGDGLRRLLDVLTGARGFVGLQRALEVTRGRRWADSRHMGGSVRWPR